MQYWLCEHTSIMNMQQSKGNCPRLMKWDMSDLPEALAQTPLESFNPEMVKDAELEPNNEKEKKLLYFLEQIENESDVKDDATRECSLDHDGSKSEKDEGVEETNNDTNSLISDLLKDIDRLKEESKEKDKDKEEEKEKRQEDEESKEGGVDRTISERVEIATGLHDEILSDKVIDKTICQIFKGTQEGERKENKKRKRERDDIDPPSMVKDLKGKDDRTVKTEEGFIYYRKNQKERKKSNSVFEMTKQFNYISKEDMELLDTIYEFEKEDKKAFVWHNQVNNDTVTIEDVLNLLNEGDIGNTCIDGLTYILERQEEKTAKTQGNNFYITSTCWTLIKEKVDARANLVNGKLKELDKVIDINGVAFYKYLIFPMNSMGGRKVKVPDHWTLLVYNTSKQQWMHYNSLTKPKKKKDPYLIDARHSGT
ncbi:hypothetical protein RHMOL_Rhmol04G0222900 [Rhododendron molle]|uniref:Uncharacterized protein n=1 Tax=Rhododendron molle TaxID=49168 RepID=A0ACC0P4W7_RHOML|nr:hypothetical protein RHMOL_Rhmol04G0222900 [Rhododendron molle]